MYKPPSVITHLQIDKSIINQKGHIIVSLGFHYTHQQQQPVLSPKNEACAVARHILLSITYHSDILQWDKSIHYVDALGKHFIFAIRGRPAQAL